MKALLIEHLEKANALGIKSVLYEQKDLQTMLTDIHDNEIKIIFVQMEKILGLGELITELSKRDWLGRVFLDECQIALEDEYRDCRPMLEMLKNLTVPKTFLTATLETKHMRHALKTFATQVGDKLELPIVRLAGATRSNLRIQLEKVTLNTYLDFLKEKIDDLKSAVTMIFCHTKTGPCSVKTVQEYLQQYFDADSVGAYHGGLSYDERKLVQDNFRNGLYRVMVATKAAALGIHNDQVEQVFLLHGADSVSYMDQMMGRAGRAANCKCASCFVLNIEGYVAPPMDDDAKDFLKLKSCLRNYLSFKLYGKVEFCNSATEKCNICEPAKEQSAANPVPNTAEKRSASQMDEFQDDLIVEAMANFDTDEASRLPVLRRTKVARLLPPTRMVQLPTVTTLPKPTAVDIPDNILKRVFDLAWAGMCGICFVATRQNVVHKQRERCSRVAKLSCYRCLGSGHMAKDCRNKVQLNAGVGACYGCWMKIDHPHVSGTAMSNVKECLAKDFVKEAAWHLFRSKNPAVLERYCTAMKGVPPNDFRDTREYANWLGSTASNLQQSQCNAVMLVCGFVKEEEGRR
jgi:hypothetical protein